MNTSTEPELHPWLLTFTIMAIPAGLAFLIGGWAGASSGEFSAFLYFVGGVATLIASPYALISTDLYRHWDSGISSQVRFAAYLAIYVGVLMSIALFFVTPFVRFIADAVGGGPGANR